MSFDAVVCAWGWGCDIIMTDVNLYIDYMKSYRKDGSTTSGIEGSTDSNALITSFCDLGSPCFCSCGPICVRGTIQRSIFLLWGVAVSWGELWDWLSWLSWWIFPWCCWPCWKYTTRWMFQRHYPHRLLRPHPIIHLLRHYRRCSPPVPAPFFSLNRRKNTLFSVVPDEMAKLLHCLVLGKVLQVQGADSICLLVLLIPHQ